MRVSTDPKLLDQRLKLLEHAQFFEVWFGTRWDRKLELACGFFHGELGRVLRGDIRIPRDMLFKLRTARARLLERAAGAS